MSSGRLVWALLCSTLATRQGFTPRVWLVPKLKLMLDMLPLRKWQ